MTTTTLSKWGTGQGVHVSRGVMSDAQVNIGDECVVTARAGIIVLDFSKGAHRRVRREAVSFSDVFAGWDGQPEDSTDPWEGLPARGAERELWS